MKLDDYRVMIDEIDAQLVSLFERRMAVSVEISLYKIAHEMPVLDEKREAKVIEKNLARLDNKDLGPEAERFFNTIMMLSRDVQRREFEKRGIKEAYHD